MARSFSAALAFVALAALASLCACSSTTSPSTGPTFSTTDLREGSGTAAVAGNTITVNYTGWLYDASKPDQKGLVFDTSYARSAFSFVLGSNSVIPGWDKGLVGMKVGGLRRLVLPPSLAYGGSRVGQIPPNSTLVFEVELLSVQ